VVENGEKLVIDRGWWVENDCKNRGGKNVKKAWFFPTAKILSKTTHVFTHQTPQVFFTKPTTFTQLLNI
jgi:hypothetical protein